MRQEWGLLTALGTEILDRRKGLEPRHLYKRVSEHRPGLERGVGMALLLARLIPILGCNVSCSSLSVRITSVAIPS
jgi:hypothetical protein